MPNAPAGEHTGCRLARPRPNLRPVPAGLHPLEHLAMVRDSLFAARTGVNRDAKSKAQAAEQLRRELPAKAPDDPAAAGTNALAYPQPQT